MTQVMTGNGRLAAVLSYTIAIAVVPGQLARLLATLGDQQMKEMEEMARGEMGSSGNGNPKPLPMLNTKGTSRNVLARLLPLGAGFLRLSNRKPLPSRGASAAAPMGAPAHTAPPSPKSPEMCVQLLALSFIFIMHPIDITTCALTNSSNRDGD